jgi:hypothetical protein
VHNLALIPILRKSMPSYTRSPFVIYTSCVLNLMTLPLPDHPWCVELVEIQLTLCSTVNFDEHDSADEETMDYVNKEAEEAEKDNQDYGKPGSFLNRLIVSGHSLGREAQSTGSKLTARTAPWQQEDRRPASSRSCSVELSDWSSR